MMYDEPEQKILDGFRSAIDKAEHKYDRRVRDMEVRLVALEQQFGMLMARVDLYKLVREDKDETH